jgi:Cu+-exporting ATPase
MNQRVFITGMTCDHCAMSVRDALEKLEGVSSVSVDLKAGAASVETESEIAFEIYERAVADAGYTIGAVE